MAKAYDFKSPIVTENGLSHTADIIKTNFVKKEDGKSLVSDELIGQITTNKNTLNNKVDKVEGSSLATSAQLTQIETNKSNIADLTGRLTSIESDFDGLLETLQQVVM